MNWRGSSVGFAKEAISQWLIAADHFCRSAKIAQNYAVILTTKGLSTRKYEIQTPAQDVRNWGNVERH